jgi:hypothetical protein
LDRMREATSLRLTEGERHTQSKRGRERGTIHDEQ